MGATDQSAAMRPDRHRLTAGNLCSLELSELLQLLVLGRKSGCIKLKRGDSRGRIWLRDGSAVHAVSDEQTGEAAFCELVAWNSGTFLIEHDALCSERSIDNDTMFLVMEAMRALDEGRPARPQPVEEQTRDAPPPRRSRAVPGRVLAIAGLGALTALTALTLLSLRGGPAAADSRPEPEQVELQRAHAAFEGSLLAGRTGEVKAPLAEPPAPTGEPPPQVVFAEPEPVVDESAVLAAAVPPPESFGPPPPPPAALELEVKSKLRGGTLELLIDGERVYAVAGQDDDGRIVASETVDIPRGEYELIARLTNAKQRTIERRAVVSLGAGERRTVRLVAGRMLGSRLTLKVVE